jgi:hypothetical protein
VTGGLFLGVRWQVPGIRKIVGDSARILLTLHRLSYFPET